MSGLGAMMVGGNPSKDRGRSEGDWYPTPPDVTRALVAKLNCLAVTTVWEPCAGNGAMADELVKGGYMVKVIQSDISPQKSDIEQVDFLTTTAVPPEVSWLITNPPFNLAEKIIRHAFKIGVPRMALVLKSTYWHSMRRQKLFDQHRPSHIMPLTWRPDFMNLGRPTMEVMWCVWSSPCATETRYIPLNR